MAKEYITVRHYVLEDQYSVYFLWVFFIELLFFPLKLAKLEVILILVIHRRMKLNTQKLTAYLKSRI